MKKTIICFVLFTACLQRQPILRSSLKSTRGELSQQFVTLKTATQCALKNWNPKRIHCFPFCLIPVSPLTNKAAILLVSTLFLRRPLSLLKHMSLPPSANLVQVIRPYILRLKAIILGPIAIPLSYEASCKASMCSSKLTTRICTVHVHVSVPVTEAIAVKKTRIIKTAAYDESEWNGIRNDFNNLSLRSMTKNAFLPYLDMLTTRQRWEPCD